MTRQQIESFIGTALLRLPEPFILAMLGRRRVVVDGLTLDPATQLLLDLMRRAGVPALETLSPADARALYSERTTGLAGSSRSMKRVIDRSVPGRERPIPVRIYVPEAGPGDLPGLVYYHGGGFVIGDLDTHDRPCRTLAEEAGCVVVSVDYRLAPEHKFPAAVEDALDAFSWVTDNACELGIDPARVAVGGDSAGGNLAAVVAQLARRGDGRQPSYQLLIYPVTDFTFSSRSYEVFGRDYFLTKSTMEWFRAHYLSSSDEQRDPRASPLHAEDLAGLPPAMVVTAGFDPLRDEGAEYAERLRAAGNQVTERCYHSLIHGFFSLAGGLATARAAVASITSRLRTALRDHRSSERSSVSSAASPSSGSASADAPSPAV